MLSSTLSGLSFLAFAALQGCRAASPSSLYEEELDRVCKAAPGSADWPTAQTWADFNQTLGGKLIKPLPPAAVVGSALMSGIRRSVCRVARKESPRRKAAGGVLTSIQCHPEQPNYDAEACEVVRAQWHSYTFHMADPTSIAWNQYSNDSVSRPLGLGRSRLLLTVSHSASLGRTHPATLPGTLPTP